jgi:hypothetical protein
MGPPQELQGFVERTLSGILRDKFADTVARSVYPF